MPASSDTLVTHLDVLSDLLVRFDIYFRSNSSIQSQALKALLPNLTNPRTAVSKRVVTTLGSLAGCCSDDIFSSLISKTVMPGLRNTEPLRLKNSVFLAGVLARASPERLATVLAELVPLVVKVSEVDEEELRDTSLQTLESLLLKCPTDMSSFIPLVINAATKAIQYDPVSTSLQQTQKSNAR
jgi:cullin-associated NEDD8-dissociated protein 1